MSSTEHRVLTRSMAKNQFTVINSNMPELRRSNRIAKKRSHDDDSLMAKKTHIISRSLNGAKRTKFPLSSLSNKSGLKKVII